MAPRGHTRPSRSTDRRRVAVPPPTDVVGLSLEGPFERPAVRTAEDAWSWVDTCLQGAAWTEARPGEGWCAWWRGPCLQRFALVKQTLWLQDDAGGRRSRAALRPLLEARGFFLRETRPHTPDPRLRGECPVHVRLGAACMGALPDDHAVDFDLDPTLTRPRAEARWRWPVQACPRCGHRAHPRARVFGEPDRETSLAAALGEVLLEGCDVDEDDGLAAACAACEAAFRPRRR